MAECLGERVNEVEVTVLGQVDGGCIGCGLCMESSRCGWRVADALMPAKCQ